MTPAHQRHSLGLFGTFLFSLASGWACQPEDRSSPARLTEASPSTSPIDQQLPATQDSLNSGGGSSAGGNPQTPVEQSDTDSPSPSVGGASVASKMSFGGAVTGPEAPPTDNSQCSRDSEWGNQVELSTINTTEHETLLAITPDELTLIFERGETLYRAERKTTDTSFDNAKSFSLPNGYDATLGIALSPDGLTLLIVKDEGQGFGQVIRWTREHSFGKVVDEEPFGILNSLSLTAGIVLSHPVFGDAGNQIWWVETTFDTSIWTTEYTHGDMSRGQQEGCGDLGCDDILDGQDGEGLYLTAISEDRLTIFLYDDAGQSLARHRDNPSSISGFFDEFSLQGRMAAQPNASCSRLYYSREGDLFFESR